MPVYVKKASFVLPTKITFTYAEGSSGTQTAITLNDTDDLIDDGSGIGVVDLNGFTFDLSGSSPFQTTWTIIKSGESVSVSLVDGNGTANVDSEYVQADTMSSYSDGTYQYVGTMTVSDAGSWGSYMDFSIEVTLSGSSISSSGNANDYANTIDFSSETWTDPSS